MDSRLPSPELRPGRTQRSARRLISLAETAQAAYGQMGADPAVTAAQHVLAWLTAQGNSRVTVRELYQGTKGRFKTVAALKPALAVLIDHGFIREEPAAPHPGPGRRSSAILEVNPWVHSHNPHNPQNSPARQPTLRDQGSATRPESPR